MDNAAGVPKPMSLHLLEEITNGFSKHRKLGEGAYGDVYLGIKRDGEKIAVKLLKCALDINNEEFEKEYRNLESLHHKNVVRLVGYCNETKREYVQYKGRIVLADETKRLLCFEYMHNGNLDKFISEESGGHNWPTRYAIIKGICEGLEYLHEKLETPLYHLDLKPANVLLDENMSPKIADFGISRLLEKTKKTNSAIGTFGYRPPEYLNAGLISVKFDIFSLGVVIIKIMTGQDGYSRIDEMSSQQFVELVHTDWMNRLQATSVEVYSIQVRRCIEIALSCLEADRHKRPSIGEIINNLSETESSSKQAFNETESTNNIIFPFPNATNKILEALSKGMRSPIDKVCPCISNEIEMLEILKNESITYPFLVTDNRGMEHKAEITTVVDPSGETSTSEPVKPRIKIINCTDGLGQVTRIDVHTTEPWTLIVHEFGNISIWNHQNQKRVIALNSIIERGGGPAKFVEPLQCIVVGDGVGYIHAYSYVKVDLLQKFRAHADGVNSLAVHPIDPFLLSASRDKMIKLWSWEAGWQCIRTFQAHSDSVFQVKFNPQTAGNTFASCSKDYTIKVWNIQSHIPDSTLHCNSNVYQTRLDFFSPSGGDGRYVVAGSRNGNAEIWDPQTNTCIKKINGLQKWGCHIAVVEGTLGHPLLLTVSQDHIVSFCDSATHRYENRVNFNLGNVRALAYIKKIRSLAIGCEDGIAIMEIS